MNVFAAVPTAVAMAASNLFSQGRFFEDCLEWDSVEAHMSAMNVEMGIPFNDSSPLAVLMGNGATIGLAHQSQRKHRPKVYYFFFREKRRRRSASRRRSLTESFF
jgi:hypothetical protein